MRVLSLLLFIVFGVSIANADDSGLKYATLDYEYVIQQSKAFTDIEKRIEAKRQSFFHEAQNKEKSLTKQRDELEKTCSELSKEVCETKMRANTEEFHQLNNTYRSQRNSLNESFSKATNKIEESLSTIIQEIVARNKYTIVFHKRMLIHSEKSHDITEEVLTLLNKHLPTVPVQFQ